MNNLFICNYFQHPVKLKIKIQSPSKKTKGKKEAPSATIFISDCVVQISTEVLFWGSKSFLPY